jgi:hypothetical protein
MLSFETAMKKIGKEMGNQKFADQITGSFFPNGKVSTDWVLSVIYGKDQNTIEKRLENLSDGWFKQRRRDLVERWKKKRA